MKKLYFDGSHPKLFSLTLPLFTKMSDSPLFTKMSLYKRDTSTHIIYTHTCEFKYDHLFQSTNTRMAIVVSYSSVVDQNIK